LGKVGTMDLLEFGIWKFGILADFFTFSFQNFLFQTQSYKITWSSSKSKNSLHNLKFIYFQHFFLNERSIKESAPTTPQYVQQYLIFTKNTKTIKTNVNK